MTDIEKQNSESEARERALLIVIGVCALIVCVAAVLVIALLLSQK